MEQAPVLLVRDINPGSGDSGISELTPFADVLYFTANDVSHGAELWRSDGTDIGTQEVADIFPGSNGSVPKYLTNFGGVLYFIANDGVTGKELWKSDGTSVGTMQIIDLNAGLNDGVGLIAN